MCLNLVLILLKLMKKAILSFQDVSFYYFIILFLIIGDGIYDRLENEQILNKIWTYKKAGFIFNDIHALYAQIVDTIIKYSMEKNSVDNVTVFFIAFKSFENKMKDPNFEYRENKICRIIKDDYDLFNLIK